MTKQTITEKQAKIKELEAEIIAELPELRYIIQTRVQDFLHGLEKEFGVSINLDQIQFYLNEQAYEENDYFLNFEYQS